MTTKTLQKNNFVRAIAFSLVLLMLFFAVSCNDIKDDSTNDNDTTAEGEIERTGAWENAVYVANKELGDGEKTVTVTVTAEEKSVVFTIHTDAEFLEEAMVENDLVDGDESSYGLYIKYVNGIRADYTLDGGYYWALTKDGKDTAYGAGSAALTDGDTYGFVRKR